MAEEPKISRAEFVDEALRYLHDSLLVGGSTRMRTILSANILPGYIQWLRDQGWTVQPPEDTK